MKAILTALFFSAIMVVKKALALFAYPFAYAAKDWVYGSDVIKNYTMPKGVQNSWLKWCFWIFLDDDQPTGYPLWYAKELLGYEPTTKWDKFKCAYAWNRFMFSGGIQKLPVINQPLTFFWGWNLDYNSRFSVAIKFK